MPSTLNLKSAATSAYHAGPSLSEEELAGPPKPVSRQERISHLDTIRGLAIMGILMSNIQDFGGSSVIPIDSLKPAFTGPHAPLNYILFVLQEVLFNSKTRGLLSMIFGAGFLLLLQRVEARHGKRRANQISVRRHLWMIALGLLHSFFLWRGDILASYGVAALLLLFLCQKLKAKTLILAGILFTLLPGSYAYLGFHGALGDAGLAGRVASARFAQELGRPLNGQQAASIDAWHRGMVLPHVSRTLLEDQAREGQQGYSARLHQNLGQYLLFDGKIIFFVLFDSGGMILLGMGLLKTGFLTGTSSTKVYVWTAILGLLTSFPLLGLGLWKVIKAGFPHELVSCWIYLPQEFTRLGATLAYAALIVLWVRSGRLKPVAAAFDSVGRMALTNYLLTSAICQFVFAWGPWKLYGEVEYYQLFWCVLAVWIVNLGLSVLWLRYFAFGPVEWLWRSLTYAKMQPMLLRNEMR